MNLNFKNVYLQQNKYKHETKWHAVPEDVIIKVFGAPLPQELPKDTTTIHEQALYMHLNHWFVNNIK